MYDPFRYVPTFQTTYKKEDPPPQQTILYHAQGEQQAKWQGARIKVWNQPVEQTNCVISNLYLYFFAQCYWVMILVIRLFKFWVKFKSCGVEQILAHYY